MHSLPGPFSDATWTSEVNTKRLGTSWRDVRRVLHELADTEETHRAYKPGVGLLVIPETISLVEFTQIYAREDLSIASKKLTRADLAADDYDRVRPPAPARPPASLRMRACACARAETSGCMIVPSIPVPHAQQCDSPHRSLLPVSTPSFSRVSPGMHSAPAVRVQMDRAHTRGNPGK